MFWSIAVGYRLQLCCRASCYCLRCIVVHLGIYSSSPSCCCLRNCYWVVVVFGVGVVVVGGIIVVGVGVVGVCVGGVVVGVGVGVVVVVVGVGCCCCGWRWRCCG